MELDWTVAIRVASMELTCEHLTANIDQGYARIAGAGSGACVDTNNNAADFFLRNPSDPQNSQSAQTMCGNPTPITIPLIRPVIINEVGWMGTKASSDDQWIELHNVTGDPVDLTGWILTANPPRLGTNGVLDLSNTSGTNHTIKPFGFYIIAQNKDVFTYQNTTYLTVDQVDSNLSLDGCSDCGDALRLISPPPGGLIDEANNYDYYPGPWPAGETNGRASMERSCPAQPDTLTAWLTYAGNSSSLNIKDFRG